MIKALWNFKNAAVPSRSKPACAGESSEISSSYCLRRAARSQVEAPTDSAAGRRLRNQLVNAVILL